MPPASQIPPVTPAKKNSSVRRIEDLRNVPRYPPFMEGLPVYPPDELLATQKDLIDSIHYLIADNELLEAHYDPAIFRLAGFVHLLPASQAHHHRGAGGLLRHSLEVGFWALQQTEGKLIRGITAPQQRREFEPRWRLAVFLAGICHDLGKVVTDITVTDRSNEDKWQPYDHSLYFWAKERNIESYFLHWREGRGKNHTNVAATLIEEVIGKASFSWINKGSTDAVIWMTESLNNNPGQSNQIHNFVVKADQVSVERDLRSMGAAMAGYEIGVPIERYLTDIMRRMVQEGLWRINEAGARIWNINDHTYLVWPMAGEEVASRTRNEDIPGLPKTADGILDMMVERGIVLMREGDGDPCFYIAPDVLTEKIPNLKLKCVRLRDQALISTMPIPSVSGKIVNENHHDAAVDAPQDHHATFGQESNHKPMPSAVPQVSCSTPGIVEAVIQKVVTVPAQNCNLTEEKPIDAGKPEDVAASTPEMSIKQLTGSMGELLKVLIEDFQTGKKSLSALSITQDHQLYLMWPHTFAGYGFTPKQILDGLTERGWMEAMSNAAKVGEVNFADGAAKAIRLTEPVSRLFPQTAKILRATNQEVPEVIADMPVMMREPDTQAYPSHAAEVPPVPITKITAQPTKRTRKTKPKPDKAATVEPLQNRYTRCNQREILTMNARLPREIQTGKNDG